MRYFRAVKTQGSSQLHQELPNFSKAANLSLMNDHECITDILSYWFGALDGYGMCLPEQHQLWFQSRAETDSHIRRCFGERVAAASSGQLDHWADGAPGLMALVLLLDQFTRNIHRGTPLAFSGDSRALSMARAAVAGGIDRSMPAIHRVFLYIPYEHSEDLAVQEQGVTLFDTLLEQLREHGSEATREQVNGFRDYAVAHRDVIARFGRFPHRNQILDRTSTAAELEHLETHGGF
jgi:uncharacterized protein (DUF924 family)